MDVITIESKAYHELMGKIEKILRYVEKAEILCPLLSNGLSV